MAKTNPITLHLKDNCFDTNGTVVCTPNDGVPEKWLKVRSATKAREVLEIYSGKKLEKLAVESQSTLSEILFGIDNVSNNDQFLFTLLSPSREEKENGAVFRIDTRNLMGWVSLSDEKGNAVRLNITSRFDGDVKKKEEQKCKASKNNGDDEDDYSKQYFLYYMLARACQVNPLFSIDVDRTGNGEKLVSVLLFINLLGKAEPYGVMRAYVKLRKNDLNVKGRIDISRHIKLNYPVDGRIAYVQRKLTADIPVNHLIRHAAESICRHYRDLLAGNSAAKSFLEQLRMATPTWRRESVKEVASSEANRVVTHPYHAGQYEPLRRMALKVLSEEGINLYGKDSDDFVSGIVFDGSWLWENYLWDVLRRSGIEGLVHSDNSNKNDPNRIHPLTGGPVTWYPDFRVTDDNDGCKAILDAKYKDLNKRLENGKYLSDDIHEVLSYMYALGARKGFLLYPYKNEGDKLPESFELSGFGGEFLFVGMKIPQSDDYSRFTDYCGAMKNAEDSFIDTLKRRLYVSAEHLAKPLDSSEFIRYEGQCDAMRGTLPVFSLTNRC